MEAPLHRWPPEGATALLELRHGSEVATLRLFGDPGRERRAYAHAGRFGIAHVERALLAAHVGPLAALRVALSRAERWDELVAAVRAEGAELRARRLLFDDQRVPHWPASMRSGAAPAHALWPFDAELAALELGRRELIRREWSVDDPALPDDAAWLARHGLSVTAHAADGGRMVLLASRSPRVLERAASVEPDVERPGPGWESAAAEMGTLLGYPSCCVAAFVTGRGRTDAALMGERLPELAHSPLPPESLWLDGALTLISHVPCTPACAPTLALAGAVRAALETARPGFGERWSSLASRLHWLTREGRMLAILGQGSLGSGAVTIDDAIELSPAGEAPSVTGRPELRGVDLVLRDAVFTAGPLSGTLLSDHRG